MKKNTTCNKAKKRKVNEAKTDLVIVDDNYIAKVTKLLAPLKVSDPEEYEFALKKVNAFKGKSLVSPEEFAAKRLNAVAPETTAQPSRDELMKTVADKNKSLAPSEIKDQTIESIWVKDIHIDPVHDEKSVAKLEIVYTDGKSEQVDFDIGTTGASGNWVEADALYKELKKNLKQYSKLAKVTDQDVRLSMIHVAFNDSRIKWFYGKNKAPATEWVFSGEQKRLANSPTAKKASKTAGKALVYKNGSTSIYRMGEDEKVSASKDMPVYIVCDFVKQKLFGAYRSMKKAQVMADSHPGSQIAIATEIK